MTQNATPGVQPDRPRRDTIIRLILVLGLVLTLGGAAACALSGFGHRWEWWHFGTGFSILRWGVYVVIAGIAASAIGLVAAALLMRRWLVLAALPAILIGGAVVSLPVAHMQRAMDVPPIHDISTDLENPPAFVALAEAREAAPNAVAYPGESTAEQQRQAYPGIVPIRVNAEREAVFRAAREVAGDLGWRIVEDDPVEGRIEAVDRTFWFGFRDDVVIRITEAEDGRTRIDVRSASRVGKSDLGKNAERVSEFLTRLQERLA